VRGRDGGLVKYIGLELSVMAIPALNDDWQLVMQMSYQTAQQS
jgi:hypothetical protein